MRKKPIAIILGGTFPHISLIKKLQKRGYYTILVDYLEFPPAKISADEHIRESTLNKDKILEIATKRNAKLVISTCIDHANLTACYVAEKLELPIPYTYKTALTVTNKILMKEIMIQNGIPTTRFYTVNKLNQFDVDLLSFPIIVKPTDSNSSKGVKRVDNPKDVSKFLHDAIKLSRNGIAIVEEFYEGTEIGVDCFVSNHKAHILMTKIRRKIPLKNDSTQQIYGCIWPADISEELYEKIQIIADKIASSFELNNTPLMIQAVINNNDVNVIEFAPRIGGGESFRIIQLSTGFDFIDAAIDSFLGKNVKVIFSKPKEYFAESFLYSKPCVFGQINMSENLLSNGTVEYFDSFKTKGMNIDSELSSNNRIGVFVVKSDSITGLSEKTHIALQDIEAYDINENPVLRKDIYDL